MKLLKRASTVKIYYLFSIFTLFSVIADAQENIYQSNGNVGIGVQNPLYKLDVDGIVRWGYGLNYIFSGEDATGGYIEQVGENSTKSPLRIQSSEKGAGHKYVQLFLDPEKGFSFMTLGAANGNVGIGTTTPKEKLSVNGNVRAHEIKVEVANWPDYVFSHDYQLPKLTETEAYIKANHHLPGVPSATEIEENGLKVGEMNAKLLQKIEELTMHLIEKDKEIIKLKEMELKVTRLEAQVNGILTKSNSSNEHQ